jgi:hypothetical protein
MNEKRDNQRKRMTLPAVAVVAVVILILIIPHAADPILYTNKQDAETLLHDRLSVLRQISQDNSGVLLPLMEDIFSSSGTLTLNIKLSDFTSAQFDLDEYLAKTRQFDNLVIKLDMSQSELEEWRRLNAQNKDDLLSLFEDSKRFSELKKLEIEYRDANNPDMLYSIMYEGEALKSKIRETIASYEDRSEEMIRVSEKFGIQTDSYIQSVHDVEVIGSSIEEEQEERSTIIQREVPPKTPLRVTLGLEPAEVRYGDTITFSGRVIGTDIRDLSLYLDSRVLKVLIATSDGTFLHREKITRIRSGMHTIYATVDGAFSDVLHFRVTPSPTSLTLENPKGQTITGRLMAGATPVSGAPIRVMSAGRQIATPTTDADGRFGADLLLSVGTHTITAIFDDTSFPLDRALSNEVEITVIEKEQLKMVEEEDSPLILILAVLFIAGAGGYWYMKRRQQSISMDTPVEIKDEDMVAEPEVHEEVLPEIAPAEPLEEDTSDSEASIESADPALQAYRASADSDYPAALRHLFLAIAADSGMVDPKSVTTGDLRQKRSSEPRLLTWISAYERVLYAGYTPDKPEQIWFEEEYRLIRGDQL